MNPRRRQDAKHFISHFGTKRFCQTCEKYIAYPQSLCFNAISELGGWISHSPEEFLFNLEFNKGLDENSKERLLYFHHSRYDGYTPFRRMRHVILPKEYKNISRMKHVLCPSCHSYVGSCMNACQLCQCEKCGQRFHNKEFLMYHLKLMHNYLDAQYFLDGNDIAMKDILIDFEGKLHYCSSCKWFVLKNADGTVCNCEMEVCEFCKDYTVFHEAKKYNDHKKIVHKFWLCKTCQELQPPEASTKCANFVCTICGKSIHKIPDLPKHDACVRAYKKSYFTEMNRSQGLRSVKTTSVTKPSLRKMSTSSNVEQKSLQSIKPSSSVKLDRPHTGDPTPVEIQSSGSKSGNDSKVAKIRGHKSSLLSLKSRDSKVTGTPSDRSLYF